MNLEKVAEAFREAGITDDETKLRILRTASRRFSTIPLVFDNYKPENDITNIVLEEIKLLKSIPPPLVVDMNGKEVEGIDPSLVGDGSNNYEMMSWLNKAITDAFTKKQGEHNNDKRSN